MEIIGFSNNKMIGFMPPVENTLDNEYFQLSNSEGEEAKVYLTQGTNALGNTIGQSGWYSFTDGQLELIQDTNSLSFTGTITYSHVVHMDYLKQVFEISK